MKKGRVFVGLSGGVDSSVSAALLKQEGYEVTGVFIKTWHPDFLPCTWKEDRLDAMRVAAHLDIPFLTLDLEKEYKENVADYMIDEYKRGRTPNPDVMCNKNVKFGGFLEYALEQGADFIATGHYARNEGTETFSLAEGTDKNKDQSYFLWTLTQNQLKHILFPVGGLEKTEVRRLAEKFGLPTAKKKDSQGVCFLGMLDMSDFLKHFIDPVKGNILNEAGEIIGTHDGAVFYTLGARHGFDVTKKGMNDAPYFVVSKDIRANTITVSHKENGTLAGKGSQGLTLENINWVSGSLPDIEKVYGARIRYRAKPSPCRVTPQKIGITIEFLDPEEPVAPGQSIVIYDGESCLGGGVAV